jgi:hypothetical protein
MAKHPLTGEQDMHLRTCALSGLFGGLIALSGCTEQVTRNATTSSMDASVQLSSSGTGEGQRFSAYLTGYTYWDNTPPGSSAIARPVLRQRAGGTGTYSNPITIAVGHSIVGGRQTLDYKEGTRFYLPRLQKYVIVEDVCGDGATPQNGPCHTGYGGRPWLDVWIGGRGMDPGAADACARRITGVQPIIMNPPSNLAVTAGEIASDGCRTFG